MSIASALFQAGATAGTVAQQSYNYRAAKDYRSQQRTAIEGSAYADALGSYAALGRRYLQETEATQQSIAAITRESQLAMGSAASANAAAGVSGATPGRLLEDYQRQALRATSAEQRNLYFSRSQLELEALAVQARQQERYNQAIGQNIYKPDYIGTILGGAAGATKALSSGK